MKHLLWASALLFGCALSPKAQKLDDSLIGESERAPREWNWDSGEAGTWNVWIELDAGTIEQFEYGADNHIRRAATLGHPEWSDGELTAALNRMGSSGFNNAWTTKADMCRPQSASGPPGRFGMASQQACNWAGPGLRLM